MLRAGPWGIDTLHEDEFEAVPKNEVLHPGRIEWQMPPHSTKSPAVGKISFVGSVAFYKSGQTSVVPALSAHASSLKLIRRGALKWLSLKYFSIHCATALQQEERVLTRYF